MNPFWTSCYEISQEILDLCKRTSGDSDQVFGEGDTWYFWNNAGDEVNGPFTAEAVHPALDKYRMEYDLTCRQINRIKKRKKFNVRSVGETAVDSTVYAETADDAADYFLRGVNINRLNPYFDEFTDEFTVTVYDDENKPHYLTRFILPR